MEMVTRSEVSQTDRKTNIIRCHYTWNLQKDTDELISNTETDPQIQKTNFGYQRGKGGRRGGIN